MPKTIDDTVDGNWGAESSAPPNSSMSTAFVRDGLQDQESEWLSSLRVDIVSGDHLFEMKTSEEIGSMRQMTQITGSSGSTSSREVDTTFPTAQEVPAHRYAGFDLQAVRERLDEDSYRAFLATIGVVELPRNRERGKRYAPYDEE